MKESKKTKSIKLLMKTLQIMSVIFVVITSMAYSAMNTTLLISGEIVFVPDRTFVEEFYYVGACESYVVPASGTYKLETWGAAGGNQSSGMNGYGGYSTGTLDLEEGTQLYVCVGGQGKTGTQLSGNQALAGGFNGGGNAWGQSDGNNGSGGGATDIRIGTNSLYARVIVAGGGGGAVSAGGGPQRGHGGGATAISGQTNYGGGCTANAGTQTAAGTGSNCGSGFTPGQTGTAYNALFGQGGNGRNASITENRAGGGGGWYGGGSTFVIGGGGSGFVWTGANAPAGYMLTETHYLSDTENINGGSTIPTHDGESTMTGNTGDGFAKISYLGLLPTADIVTFYLNGSADMQLNVGATYTESGATLKINGVDMSNNVVVSGTVNTGTAGTYTRTYSYTYNGKNYKLTRRILVQNAIAYTGNFSYTGSQQSLSVPYTGWYKLEVWGAQGGDGTGSNSPGGYGGYSVGTVWLTANTTLNIYVGQQGIKYSTGYYAPGGWNGGGHGGEPYTGLCTSYYGGSGGGATDIRIDGSGLYNRLIVAGGGGGGSGLDNTGGGAGGGANGNAGSGGNGKGQGGTQTSGGSAGTDGTLKNRTNHAGNFGAGGNGNLIQGVDTSSGVRSGGGGGGGWYGGGTGSNRSGNCISSGSGGGAGGGGSGFTWYDGMTVPGGYGVSGNYHMGGTSMTVGTKSGNGSATITYIKNEQYY